MSTKLAHQKSQRAWFFMWWKEAIQLKRKLCISSITALWIYGFHLHQIWFSDSLEIPACLQDLDWWHEFEFFALNLIMFMSSNWDLWWQDSFKTGPNLGQADPVYGVTNQITTFFMQWPHVPILTLISSLVEFSTSRSEVMFKLTFEIKLDFS